MGGQFSAQLCGAHRKGTTSLEWPRAKAEAGEAGRWCGSPARKPLGVRGGILPMGKA